MFKRFTDGYFALGLILGVSLTILILVWGKPIYEFAYCQGDQKCRNYTANYEGGNPPDGSIWHWDGRLVSSGDTLAQWIMAILTIAAVVLLWRTLSSANQTNLAAIRAANAATQANQIMRDEQRPWVTIELPNKHRGFSVRVDGINLRTSLTLTSVGKNLAKNVFFSTSIVRIHHTAGVSKMREDIEPGKRRLIERVRKMREATGSGTVLFPGDKIHLENMAIGAPFSLAVLNPDDSEDNSMWFAIVCVVYDSGTERGEGLEFRAFRLTSLKNSISEIGYLREIY